MYNCLNAVNFAAQNDNLGCLKYAHKNGCKIDTWTCEYAVNGESLQCLEYCCLCQDVERSQHTRKVGQRTGADSTEQI